MSSEQAGAFACSSGDNFRFSQTVGGPSIRVLDPWILAP